MIRSVTPGSRREAIKMGNSCSVCIHEEKPSIDAAIAGGISVGEVARRWNLPEALIAHHARAHVRQKPPLARNAAQALGSDLLESTMRNLISDISHMLRAAKKCGDIPGIIALVREQRENCKFFSEIQERILVQKGGEPEYLANTALDSLRQERHAGGARRTILPSDTELQERARQAITKALGIDGALKERIEHENGGGDSG